MARSLTAPFGLGALHRFALRRFGVQCLVAAACLGIPAVSHAQMIENIPRPEEEPEEDPEPPKKQEPKEAEPPRRAPPPQETKPSPPEESDRDAPPSKSERPADGEKESPPAKKKSNAGDPTSGKTRLDPGCRGECPPPVRDVRRERDDEKKKRRTRKSRRPSSVERSARSHGRRSELPLRGQFMLSPHLTIADDRLASVGNRIGGGLDALFAVGPPGWPVLGGVQFGFDGFGGPQETFTFNGITDDYRLNLSGFWLNGLLRLQPAEGTIRPFLDLFGGFWSLHVTAEEPDGIRGSTNANQAIGNDVTGHVGVGAGVQWILRGGMTVGLAGMYMRGGGVTVPNVNDISVVDNVLYYGESSLDHISQGLILLQIGFTDDGR